MSTLIATTDGWQVGATIASSVAAVAAVVGAVMAVRSSNVAIKLASLETMRRAEEIRERRSAIVRARFYFDGRKGCLEVWNDGPADATGVRVEFRNGEPPTHFRDDAISTTLRAGDRWEATFTHMPQKNYPATISWRDGRLGPGDPPLEISVPYVLVTK